MHVIGPNEYVCKKGSKTQLSVKSLNTILLKAERYELIVEKSTLSVAVASVASCAVFIHPSVVSC